MKSIGVEPEKFGWFNKDYSEYPVDTNPVLAPRMRRPIPSPQNPTFVTEEVPYVDPRPARPLKPVLLTISLAFLVLFVGGLAAAPYLLYATQSGGREMPLYGESFLFIASTMLGLGATAMSLFAAMSFSKNLWLRIPGLLLSSIFVVNFTSNLISGNVPMSILFGVSVFGGAIFGAMFTMSLPYKQRVKKPTLVARPVHHEVSEEEEYYAPRYYPAPGAVHGTPGGVAGSTGTFSQEAIAAGVKGEENTAEMLKLLLKIPGTSIFHGLKFPGSKTADVDHALSHGTTAYLIDSKMFRTGVYEWDAYEDRIVSPGNEAKNNYMSVVADGYRKMLPPQAEVVAIVIVHGRNVSIGKNRWSSNGVGLFTAEEAMAFMGDRMSEKMPTWVDYPELRGTLIDNMKY